MDLMSRRRALMFMASGGEGLNTKVMTGLTGPASVATWTITHNIGVVPKLITIVDDNQQGAIGDYNMGEIYYIVLVPENTLTFQKSFNGAGSAKNLASGNKSTGTYEQVNNVAGFCQYSVTATELKINKPLSNSDWSVASSYTVTFYY